MKNILFLGTGNFKKHIFEYVGQRHNIYLLTNRPLTWEKHFVKDYRVIDTFDKKGSLKKAMEFNSLYGIDGAMIISEPYVEIAGVIFDALNLPGVSEEVARRCRDKFEMKKCLKEHDVLVAEGFKVNNLQEFIEAAISMEESFVVKPIASWSSYGVTRVLDKSISHLTKVYEDITSHTNKKNKNTTLIVEEYLDGKELSVESLIYDGKVFPIAINDKVTPLEGPYFFDLDYILHFERTDEEENRIFQVTKDALKALGIENGVAHLEMRCTSRGYKILEVASRLGGCSLPEAVEKTTGINMYAQYLNIALGQKPEVQTQKLMCAGTRLINRYKEGTITDILNIDQTLDWDGIEEVAISVKPGHQIISPPKNYKVCMGYVYGVGNSQKEVSDLLEKADENIKFVLK